VCPFQRDGILTDDRSASYTQERETPFLYFLGLSVNANMSTSLNTELGALFL
jgi:hypothetical protein